MKIFILIFSFCALVAVSLAGFFLLSDDKPLPIFLDEHGNVVTLPENTKVSLHFWGAWCGPCVQELPELDKYAGRHPEISIYAIHVGPQSMTEVRNAYTQLQIKNLKIYQDPKGALAQHFHIRGFPSTLEVTSDFQETRRLTGPQQWQYYD